MSMTSASSQYFEQVAGQWDDLRQGYFSESLRAEAIAKAYLRPEMVVADVGSGTGFIAAGLAPLVKQVHVIDGSPAMLAVARQNLAAFGNVVYHEAGADHLPLPDNSLDAVFANMLLHHCPDPLAAIREMTRVLRPGGRLVISDMDAHEYTWLKEEMADEWPGFERAQLLGWLEQAGLVNRLVACSGQSCCATSQQAGQSTPEARISVFIAVGSQPVKGVHAAVQAGYGARAEGQGGCCTPAAGGQSTTTVQSCCAPASSSRLAPPAQSCCGPAEVEIDATIFDPAYTGSQLKAVPAEAAEIALGCGNPTALAGMQPGEVVVDIGSGGGLDAFLAAQAVGPAGKVIGVDMTPAMLKRARRAAEKAGLHQVEFRRGQAEALPVEDASADVILSNCVINLTEDKGKVFDEAFRVLRPGGRLEVSDMVTSGSFPAAVQGDAGSWAGCVAGALPEQEYLDLIAQAGFEEVRVRRSPAASMYGGVSVYSITVSARKLK